MPGPYKTPGVYVEEISTFPPSVAEVGTAIPAFIGYTETARLQAAGDLILKPTKIYSLKEYESLYGFPFADPIEITIAADGAGGYKVTAFKANTKAPLPSYLLYYAVKMYFDNGGGECYIVSAGAYAATPAWNLNHLKAGLDAVALEDEPTLIVIPEAVLLSTADYTTLVQAVLLQCETLDDRFAIFDLYDGHKLPTSIELGANRGYFGNNHLKYGAAYYPFLRTAMSCYVKEGATTSNVTVKQGTKSLDLMVLKNGAPEVPGTDAVEAVEDDPATTNVDESKPGIPKKDKIDAIPPNTSAYNFVKAALKDHLLVMPPSAAVAGVYAATDGARGVWKAPANVSLAGVVEPVVRLDNQKQADFNVDPASGKSINALRAFAGKGTLVWGARTLAGNDNEWRYVPVRRFFNMAEESIRKSTSWAVFEPNDANTWTKVRGMIESYLIEKWRDGALAGATPKDAFFVKCGLGTTMNAQDILEGRMNVEIGMAVVRPAEFIILKFSHKLQTS